MTEINGTEKQIAWAKQIRETLLNGTMCQNICTRPGMKQTIEINNREIESLKNELKTETNQEEIEDIQSYIAKHSDKRDKLNILKSKIENESDSVWFIENRVLLSLLSKEDI